MNKLVRYPGGPTGPAVPFVWFVMQYEFFYMDWAKNRQRNEQLIRSLVELGADLNWRNERGQLIQEWTWENLDKFYPFLRFREVERRQHEFPRAWFDFLANLQNCST